MRDFTPRPLLVLFLAFTLLAPAVMWASGTSYPSAATTSNDPLLVTKSLKVRLVEVGPEQSFKIVDTDSEIETWIQVSEDTNLRAQDRKAFDGRRKLELSDLQVGQMLRINYRPATGEILRIKVLRERDS